MRGEKDSEPPHYKLHSKSLTAIDNVSVTIGIWRFKDLQALRQNFPNPLKEVRPLIFKMSHLRNKTLNLHLESEALFFGQSINASAIFILRMKRKKLLFDGESKAALINGQSCPEK